jgi:hypothetical protein
MNCPLPVQDPSYGSGGGVGVWAKDVRQCVGVRVQAVCPGCRFELHRLACIWAQGV